jgi:hypothetical protein
MHLLKKLTLLCSILWMQMLLHGDEACKFEPEECNFEPEECNYEPEECICRRSANQVYIGPEVYHLNRNAAGKQHGWIYGARAGYDHIKRFKFYWGAEEWYGTGILHGKSGKGDTIKSRFKDFYIEGRLGYTFQQKCGYRLSITPFFGGGYAVEKNNFVHPSPVPAHIRLYYQYACGGFLSQASLTPRLDVGVNFKVKYTFDGRIDVTHDPDFDPFHMLFKDRNQYKVEVPLTYHFTKWLFCFEPFYETRKYGEHANFPFDFFETKLRIYGATLKFIFCL